jgi:hypothetical protein
VEERGALRRGRKEGRRGRRKRLFGDNAVPSHYPAVHLQKSRELMFTF